MVVKIPRNKLDGEGDDEKGLKAQKRRRMTKVDDWNSQNSNAGTPKGANHDDDEDDDGFGMTNTDDDDDDDEDSGREEATASRDGATPFVMTCNLINGKYFEF